MPRYAEMSKAELEAELAEVRARYGEMAARGLKLNMARGKPSAAQLELSLPMLDVLDSEADLAAEDGTDCRNYGVLDGNRCGACRTVIDGGRLIDLRNQAPLGMCPSCKRLLVIA